MDQAAIDKLASETASALSRAAGTGDADALRGAVFLYLNRAYEAKLDPDLICDLFGVSQNNILSQAKLSKGDEAAALDAYAQLDPILEKQYR